MRKPLQKILLFTVLLISGKSFAQPPSTTNEKNTDSVSQLSFRFINNKNIDDLIALLVKTLKRKCRD